MNKAKIILSLLLFLVCFFPALASALEKNREEDKNSTVDQIVQEIMQYQGVDDMQSIDCGKVTPKQLEDLGDAIMDFTHPDPSERAFMNRTMGKDGSQNQAYMHRMMGAGYLGCYEGGGSFDRMFSFMGARGSIDRNNDSGWGWGHMPMHGYGPYNMMGPYGGVIMWILFLIILGFIVYFFARRSKSAGTGDSPLDILKKRYAAGEITKDEFEQKKKDLEL